MIEETAKRVSEPFLVIISGWSSSFLRVKRQKKRRIKMNCSCHDQPCLLDLHGMEWVSFLSSAGVGCKELVRMKEAKETLMTFYGLFWKVFFPVLSSARQHTSVLSEILFIMLKHVTCKFNSLWPSSSHQRMECESTVEKICNNDDSTKNQSVDTFHFMLHCNYSIHTEQLYVM